MADIQRCQHQQRRDHRACQYIWTQPLQMFWPGLALFISVMAFNLVGDALRDHLDPHLLTEHAH